MKLKFLYLLPFLTLWQTACSRLDSQDKATSTGAPAEQNPNSENAGKNGKPNGRQTPKPADPSNLGSVDAFKLTVYPLVRQHCVKCHAQGFSPFFAANDVKQAHEALILEQKVNLKDVTKSRLYLRLKVDHHNCAVGADCEQLAEKMETALTAWVTALPKQPVDNPTQLPTTTTQLFSDAVDTTVAGVNPEGVSLVEASAFTLRTPMAMTADVTIPGGNIIGTPATAGSVTNIQTATASQTLGTARYTFDVKTAGSYLVHGLVNGAAAANASFYVRMDNGALAPWIFGVNGSDFSWNPAARTAGGAPIRFNLTVGSHTLEIRQRQAAAKIARVVLSSIETFDPAGAEPAQRPAKHLSFDLSDVVHLAGAKLTIEVADYSANAYLFKNPLLTVPSGSIRIKDMRLLINGEYQPQHATFTAVDDVVAAPGKILSDAALVALKDKGLEEDQFSFTFSVLEAN